MLKQLLNKEHFNKFINLFEERLNSGDYIKSIESDKIMYDNINKFYYMIMSFNKLKTPTPISFKILNNILFSKTIHINIKDTETQLINSVYKIRLNQIYSYKLLIYYLKKYPSDFIYNDYNSINRYIDSSINIKHKLLDGDLLDEDLVVLEQFYNNESKYNYNRLSSPLNRTIYDDVLHKTVKEYNTLLNKLINLQKKIVGWYKHQTKIRKTRLLLTSYRQLNKRRIQLPNDIICNKILKLNY